MLLPERLAMKPGLSNGLAAEALGIGFDAGGRSVKDQQRANFLEAGRG